MCINIYIIIFISYLNEYVLIVIFRLYIGNLNVNICNKIVISHDSPAPARRKYTRYIWQRLFEVIYQTLF